MKRIDFVTFNCNFMIYSNMTNAEVAVYAPLIYRFEDKYFNACEKFLKTGEKTNVEFEKYSTDMLQLTMGTSYIEALVILHNIETMPNDAPNIFNPNIVE
ncbi:MAG: hypothetical protein E7376_00910 [Clostridiales bacterium]|nr:hypothetical protein [Clostridiales bacterium]